MTVGVDATDLFDSYVPADARQYRYHLMSYSELCCTTIPFM